MRRRLPLERARPDERPLSPAECLAMVLACALFLAGAVAVGWP